MKQFFKRIIVSLLIKFDKGRGVKSLITNSDQIFHYVECNNIIYIYEVKKILLTLINEKKADKKTIKHKVDNIVSKEKAIKEIELSKEKSSEDVLNEFIAAIFKEDMSKKTLSMDQVIRFMDYDGTNFY